MHKKLAQQIFTIPAKAATLVLAGLLSFVGFAGTAQAGLITVTETFSEFGSRGTVQSGFSWLFTGLGLAAGGLTIEFDWERMDFDDDATEYMDIFAEGTLLGRIGTPGGTCIITGDFFRDCDGSKSFIVVSGALLDDGILSLTSTQSNVNSSGGSTSISSPAPFGFIGATLTYQMEQVPAPATLALFGLGLAGIGWSRRNKV